MLIHITRHGQPTAKGLPPGTDHEYPPGDPVLSVLGRRQAGWLGKRLAGGDFRGSIFSSPYRRALETASVIAEATSLTVTPEPALQEYVPIAGTPTFDGLQADDMARLYERVKLPRALPYPWFVSGPETDVDVQDRIRPFIEKLLASDSGDALLVGHGASVHACIAVMGGTKREEDPFNWNCSLTTFEIVSAQNARRVRHFDTTHIPPRSVTSNALYAHTC
ncbi:MAG: histidine phosphatase family protein [Lentisphaerae bacterium]|jgi:broad specificity phosphatase PhoE|nr:histidine phosphatase family protein [Lentisphaerota bacterium]MBT4820168.1 histidine phosphatase family protein [Lentisphaerota bacterium]MBT5611505.1 histidine phosphatase family protein [Lentisphaerota bacterium]MBT7061156.1 histidine phosphatase family protein [Lentisphaerota bacterium]MBT7845765.1 histidine phosphatase family protein [Lentisphaerota bacterium]